MRAIAILLAASGIACVPRYEPQPVRGEYRGLLRSAFESSGVFQPCGAPDSAAHVVRFGPGVAPAVWPAAALSRDKTRGTRYVRWRAHIAAVGRLTFGDSSAAPAYWVDEVLEIRAPRRGECGYRQE